MSHTKAILFIHFGTPDTPSQRSVRMFLKELLLDRAMLPFPWPLRQLLVRAYCLTKYCSESTSHYKAVWTKQGSPLLINATNFTRSIQKRLQVNTTIFLAMRYGTPSLQECLNKIQQHHFDSLLIVPCFPIQTRAITSSILHALEPIAHWQHVPKITFLPEFYNKECFIKASAERLKAYRTADHILFSYHALPEKDSYPYIDQCKTLSKAIANEAHITNYSTSFQSKMGRGRWTEPSTQDMLSKLLARNNKQILVATPGFTVDCVETLWEVGIKYRNDFLQMGGTSLELAPCLNDFPPWVEGFASYLEGI